jgi:hypothetical protein
LSLGYIVVAVGVSTRLDTGSSRNEKCAVAHLAGTNAMEIKAAGIDWAAVHICPLRAVETLDVIATSRFTSAVKVERVFGGLGSTSLHDIGPVVEVGRSKGAIPVIASGSCRTARL